MALTSPDNIWTPDAGEQYALTTDLATTADSIQNAITEKANYGVGTTAEMNAAVNRFPDGAMWYNTTNDTEYRRVSGAWVAQDVDTGWVDLTLTNGWSVQSNRTPRIRRIGKVVYLTGQVTGGNSGQVSETFPDTCRSVGTLLFPTFSEEGRYLSVLTNYLSTNSTGSGLVLNYSWVAGDA